jgi:hypothetical protein
MIEQMISSNWAASAHLPSYGLTLVGALTLAVLAIKILLVAKEGDKGKAKKEWVFSEERDADGMPLLASARGESSSARIRRPQQLRSRI